MKIEILTPELIQELDDQLKYNAVTDSECKQYIIKYKGQRIKRNSGKTVWNSIGAAKNALHFELEYFYRKKRISNPSQFLSELIITGIITIEELN